MDKLLEMSAKELTRLEVMQRLKEKRLQQKEAARLLGLSVRQVKRVWEKYRKQAARGVLCRSFQPGVNKIEISPEFVMDVNVIDLFVVI